MRQNYDLAILGMYLRGCDCVCEKPVQQKQHAKRDVTPAPQARRAADRRQEDEEKKTPGNSQVVLTVLSDNGDGV